MPPPQERVNAPIQPNPAFSGRFEPGLGQLREPLHALERPRAERATLDRRRRDGHDPGVEQHRVWAEVDLGALARNLRAVRARAGTGRAVMLVVKADAYGHGAVAVAHAAVRGGVSALGVGNSAEALELRQAGVCAPILVLGTIVEDEAAPCVRHEVEIGLHSRDRVRRLESLCRRLGTTARVHLNVDTGWGQLGVPPARGLELLEHVHRSNHLDLAGVMTHFSSSAGAADPLTRTQIARLEAFLEEARRRDLPAGPVHAANSAFLFSGGSPLYDMVRPGIAAYGILPGGLAAGELEPVLSVHTQVVFVKDLPRGASLGYDATWRATRPTRIATLPVGYKDGLPFRLSNAGEVLVRGRRAPVLGRVSMDYVSVDVGHIPDVRVGDRATLVGAQGEDAVTVQDVAGAAGTIPYEITCALGRQVPRFFRESGEPADSPRTPAPGARAAPAPAPAVPPRAGA